MARDSRRTLRKITRTLSSRFPKFSLTMRFPARIKAARSSAWERSKTAITEDYGGQQLHLY
jgi:hypothetical protein